MSNTLMSIPLCQLKRSKTNIRKTEPLADIEQLAASIEANGLLENLIVLPMEMPNPAEPDLYEVIAGGRRLAALKLLLKRKKIARDYPVHCLVLERLGAASPVEVSLTENIVRAPIHPADQFDAFLKLQKDGLPAEDIAARFGLSTTVVLQRLKLAAVSPRLMAEYRSGEMTLEQLMAFTISDDQKAQEEAWFENPFGDSSPQAIRRYLTKSLVEGGDRRARFIGAKLYEEAGGIVVRDLFQPEEDGYFTDSQLLDRLVVEKLQAEAEKVRAEGWGWVETTLESDFEHLAHFGRIKVTEVDLSEEDEARLSSLCERYDELVAALEEEGAEETSAELARVTAELEVLQAKKEIWPEEEKTRAGVILSLDSDGQLRAVRGLLKAEERIPEEAGQHPRSPAAKTEQTGSNEKPDEKSNGYSESLLVDLSAHRTMALREVLAGQTERALVALLHALVRRVFFQEEEGCIGIEATIADLGKASQTVGESKAAAALLVRHNRWLERLPERKDLWDWLESLEDQDRLELLAYCTAMAVDAVRRPWNDRERTVDAENIARAVSLDMTEWWQPTYAGFFDHLTKSQILKAVEDGVSREAALRLADRKKSQMGHDAELLLAKSRWIPQSLRMQDGEQNPANEAPAEAAAE